MLGQEVIMEWTTVKMSELMRQKSLRMDPKYWIKKKLKKRKKLQAPSSKLDSGSGR